MAEAAACDAALPLLQAALSAAGGVNAAKKLEICITFGGIKICIDM